MFKQLLIRVTMLGLLLSFNSLYATSSKQVYYGVASWYGPGFHGHKTASGEVFNKNRSTLASRHLPFGTIVKVTCLKTGKTAVAKVTDRGPFVRGRIADCSEGLAKKIGLKSAGVSKVKIEVLK